MFASSGLADQPVTEAVVAERRRHPDDEAQLTRLLERGQQAVTVKLRCVLERGELKAAAEDRCQLERLDRGRREWLQAAADRLAYAVGKRQLVGRIVEPSLGEQQRDDLAREERVALGEGIDRLHELCSRFAAACQRDQPRDVLLRQPSQHEPPARARDVGQRDLLVGRALGHALVHRDDEQDRGISEHPRDEVQREERALVDRLQVVDHHDDRRVGAARAQQRNERVEEREAGDVRALGAEREVARRLRAG